MSQDLAPNAAKKLGNYLARLEKEYGQIKLLPDAPPLEQVIYLILREFDDHKKAAKALAILQREYVEWNELRVATPKEIVAVLEEVKLTELDDKISRILAVLSRLFYDFHKKDLEFVRLFETPQRTKILLQLEPMGLHLIYVLLQFFEDHSPEPEGLVISQHAVNVVTRLGLMRKTSSLNIAKKLLEKIVPPKERVRFQYLIHRVDPKGEMAA